MKTLALQGRCSESHLTGGVWKHFTLCSAYYLCFQNQKKKSDATCTACQAAKSLKPKLTISSTCDPPYWNEIMSAEVTIDYLLPWGGWPSLFCTCASWTNQVSTCSRHLLRYKMISVTFKSFWLQSLPHKRSSFDRGRPHSTASPRYGCRAAPLAATRL